MHLGVEGGDADALGREGIRVRARCSLDQAVETEATQVIAHLRRAGVTPEESGNTPAEPLVGEAGDGVDDEAECT